MRRLSLLVLMIAAVMELNASFFISNALGQDLGPVENLSGTGYEGEKDGDITRLYLDGELVRERTDDADGSYTITEGNTSESVIYENGIRTSRIVDDNGVNHEYRYSYDGDILRRVTYSVDGELVSIVEYIETPSGKLAALAGTEEGYFTPDYYIYERDGEYIKAEAHSFDGSVFDVPSGYTLSEDGTWHGTSVIDGIEYERVYSADGLLISERTEGIFREFSYDDEGNLSLAVSEEGDIRTETAFADGERASERRYIEGKLSSERTFRSDGLIEELRFRDDEPYARILFDRDGLRVLEVENLG